MLSTGETESLKNQLASDWMHRGIELLEGPNSVLTLKEAVCCFDKAIALRRTLPLANEPWFRYALSAGFVNRGDALARIGECRTWSDAVRSYDEALVLLRSLPLEQNSLYCRRLAITWINRGIIFHRQGTAGCEAERCFRKALAVIALPASISIADFPALNAGAWSNLALALADSGIGELEEPRAAARTAILHARGFEKVDVFCGEAVCQAIHVLCRLAVRELSSRQQIIGDVMDEVTKAATESLSIARHWIQYGQSKFDELSRDSFRFGCRLIAEFRPRFLVEFVMKSMTGESALPGLARSEQALLCARAAVWSAFNNILSDGFEFVNSTSHEATHTTVKELREADEWLNGAILCLWTDRRK